jgi:hypothetical protein
MVIVPHPPYSQDLAPCDFALFPKLKMKLKGRRFETVSDIQRESQAVFDSIKEHDFHCAFEVWKKNDGIAVYVPKEITSKEMAAKIEQASISFLTYSRNFPTVPSNFNKMVHHHTTTEPSEATLMKP